MGIEPEAGAYRVSPRPGNVECLTASLPYQIRDIMTVKRAETKRRAKPEQQLE